MLCLRTSGDALHHGPYFQITFRAFSEVFVLCISVDFFYVWLYQKALGPFVFFLGGGRGCGVSSAEFQKTVFFFFLFLRKGRTCL